MKCNRDFFTWDYNKKDEDNKDKYVKNDGGFKAWIKSLNRCADCDKETYAELLEEWCEEDLKNGDCSKENSIFVSDGIVDPEEWGKQSKKILFITKEAYNESEPEPLKKAYNESKPLYAWDNIENVFKTKNMSGKIFWRHVYQWTEKILNPEADNSEILDENRRKKEFVDVIKKIAVINVKKMYGNKKSVDKDLEAYVARHSKHIIKQIEIINPDIIICGYTCWLLDEGLKKDGKPIIRKEKNKSMSYNTEVFNDKNITVIDFWHPSGFHKKEEKFLNILSESLKGENLTKN